MHIARCHLPALDEAANSPESAPERSVAALAVYGWSVPVAHSAPPAASAAAAQAVALEVDVDDLPEDERGIASVVLEHMRELVEGGGYAISDDPSAATVLRVRLRRLEAGDQAQDFAGADIFP